jgi:hypothetical protein
LPAISSSRFVDHFTDSWLDLRNLRRDDPDIRFYPEYRLDDFLTESAGLETRAFFNAMVRENLPAVNVVTSDFTWVNERLARHYGLPHVSGAALRKVRLPPAAPMAGFSPRRRFLRSLQTALDLTRPPWRLGHGSADGRTSAAAAAGSPGGRARHSRRTDDS